MPTYYDYMLGAIPLVPAGTAGLLTIAGVEPMTTILSSGAIALSLIGHSLFVNPPIDPSAGETRTTAAESAGLSTNR